jgi:biotin carboxyl carrier protein
MEGLTLVISPATGRIHLLPPQAFAAGREVVTAGQAVAIVNVGGRQRPVVAFAGGSVSNVLVLEGEPVRAGQPILAVASQ